MKVLKKSSVVFAMIMVLILNIMSVSAGELPKEAVYDFYSAKRGVERYLSPVSGRSTTIFFPSFSGRFASSIAA